MSNRHRIKPKSLFLVIAITLLILPLLLYTQFHFRRPPGTNIEIPLFQGIDYYRQARTNPRPYMLHVVSIDLTVPGIKVMVTPGLSNSNEWKTNARTTEAFLKEFKLKLAVNASYFFPFQEHTPWDFYPHSGDKTNVVGQAISESLVYSPAQSKWPVICFNSNQKAQIIESGKCPKDTVNGVAGRPILVANGVPVSLDDFANDKPYARLAVAIDKLGTKLWLIVIDGKQPFYSEGVTLAELSKIVVELGADRALNLDGGGSTTLVIADGSSARLLNAPIHTKLPMRQRPVANHLGFYALPKNSY